MFTLSSPPAILSASVSLPEKRELRLPMASENLIDFTFGYRNTNTSLNLSDQSVYKPACCYILVPILWREGPGVILVTICAR